MKNINFKCNNNDKILNTLALHAEEKKNNEKKTAKKLK